MMYRLSIVATLLLVSRCANAQTPVVVDMSKEAFAASDQAFGRLMDHALSGTDSASFISSAIVLAPPSDAAFTFVFEGIGSLALWRDVTPLGIDIGPHLGTQLLTLPRPSTDTLMAGTPYTFAPGSLSFSTSDSVDAMTFFAGLSLFSHDGGSYLVGGYVYSLEFENVTGRASPYLFTNVALVEQLRGFLLAGLSASEQGRFSRLGGGFNYRFVGLVPALSGERPGDIDAGVYYASLRQVLEQQKIKAVSLKWYPHPRISGDSAGDVAGSAADADDGDLETRVDLQIGSLAHDYDYLADESGIFVKASAAYAMFSAGVNFLPANRLIDVTKGVGAEPGGRNFGWQLAVHLGTLFSLSMQRDYLLADGFAAPLIGTTFALMTNLTHLGESN